MKKNVMPYLVCLLMLFFSLTGFAGEKSKKTPPAILVEDVESLNDDIARYQGKRVTVIGSGEEVFGKKIDCFGKRRSYQ